MPGYGYRERDDTICQEQGEKLTMTYRRVEIIRPSDPLHDVSATPTVEVRAHEGI